MKKAVLFLLGVLVLLGGLFFASAYLEPKNYSLVLLNPISPKAAVKSAVAPVQIPTLTPTPYVLPSAVPTKRLKKQTYTIALYGDSMVDTMGEKLEFLAEALESKYPKTTFQLYNYGIGGENIKQGLDRFPQSFANKTRQYPPIAEIHPDVLILGSFAYNPFDPHDVNRYWLTLTELVEQAKAVSPRVYLLAEIAPLGYGFGKGKNGINWPQEQAYTHALRIIEQLNSAVDFTKAFNLPLIDAYHPSQQNGQFGAAYLVNAGDGIHPSNEGHLFIADKIVETILLE
ncbi:MAG: hypothetical protein HYY87_01195 [Candidatus Levybacteria bacterium]|nr:hypothetical protein [Candidatus Levybacteria bacterium]